MKYVRLAYLSFADRLISNLVLILQLIIMFILVNLMIGSVNSRTMLTDTYQSFIDKQGWYVNYFEAAVPDETTGETDKNTDSDQNGLLALAGSLGTEPKIVKIYNAPVVLENGYMANIMILPDELFDDITLPTKSAKKADECKLLLFSNGSGIKVGQSISFLTAGQKKLNATVSALLTDPSYIPIFNEWSIDGDISMLYNKVSSETESIAYMITNETSAQRIGLSEEDMSFGSNAVFYFPERISDSDLSEMEQKLSENMNVAFTPLSVIKEKAEEAVDDDINKYMPLAVVVIIIVIIGTAGAIAIQTLDEIKSFAVYFLCGMKWRRIFLISLFRVLFLLAAALLISFSAMMILQTTGIAANLGLVFNNTNLNASILLAMLTLFSSILLPFILLRKASPAETIRRIKND